MFVNTKVPEDAAIVPAVREIPADKFSVCEPISRGPDVRVRVPDTDRFLLSVTPAARLTSKSFMAEMVVELPGNAEAAVKTIFPLFTMVPPPVYAPFMVKVAPASI